MHYFFAADLVLPLDCIMSLMAFCPASSAFLTSGGTVTSEVSGPPPQPVIVPPKARARVKESIPSEKNFTCRIRLLSSRWVVPALISHKKFGTAQAGTMAHG